MALSTALALGLSFVCSVGHAPQEQYALPLDSLMPQARGLQPSLREPSSGLLLSAPRLSSLRLKFPRGPRLARGGLFGYGGLRVRLNGSAELGIGMRERETEQPNLHVEARQQRSFFFDQKIQVKAELALGTKLGLNLGYDTEATLQSDARHLRLWYHGTGAEWIRSVDVGQVSFTPQNSLLGTSRTGTGLSAKLQSGGVALDLFLSTGRHLRAELQRQPSDSRQSFSIPASAYDEGRHFFLSDYFRAQYDAHLSQLPEISSGIRITRIEVWVRGHQERREQTRPIIAFADLGEATNIHSSYITSTTSTPSPPANAANSLYATLVGNPLIRQPSQTEQILGPVLRSGLDYDKLSYARQLAPEEYVLNAQLGYISLVTKLQPQEILAVAYEYTYQGRTYRVGELSSQHEGAPSDALYVKLLKGPNPAPSSPYWSYMMRHVYSLGIAPGALKPSSLQLGVYRRSDETGSEIAYVPDGVLKGRRYLELLGMDRLDVNQQRHSDGHWDLIEGITLNSTYGWIYLPTSEPFGATLTSQGIEAKYRYGELYQLSPTEARQQTAKDKYLLKGTYSLGAGVQPSALRPTAPLSQRRTLLGANLRYQFGKSLRLGLSALYLREHALSARPLLGQEPMSNLAWGASLSWRWEMPWLTRLLDALPLTAASKPSLLSLEAEWAELRPNFARGGYYQGTSILDDFETSYSYLDLLAPSAWSLASTPTALITSGTAGIAAGYGRGHLSWFTIDPVLTREGHSRTPNYIRTDPQRVSSHYVREIDLHELYPERQVSSSKLSYIPTLSLRYYPEEPGMYNLAASRLGASGVFTDPRQSWAGIQRPLELSDFEAANVESLEFWLLDPFLDQPSAQGGDLYIHLGEISEDILRDGYSASEQDLPPYDDAPSATLMTDWGRVAREPGLSAGFDTAPGARARQDVGLNGLSSEQEHQHPSYQAYLGTLSASVSPAVRARWLEDPHSPLNDPAHDDFRHYLDSRWDDLRADVLERYKYYNGLEGNSPEGRQKAEQPRAARTTPDGEDTDHDGNLLERDRYYEYRISLRPKDLVVGQNYIISSRTTEVSLRDGRTSPARWLQFRIPLASYTAAVGGITDLRTMRYLRLCLSDFSERVDLRFGSLQLARGSWRVYDAPLYPSATPPTVQAALALGSVNIEEHSDRVPVNYVLPPDVSRTETIDGAEELQRSERALSMQIQQLAPSDARAMHHSVQYDLRPYSHLQLYVHAEELLGHETGVTDGDLELFLRLGSDLTNNYYEYTLPLAVTPRGRYHNASEADRHIVWPRSNFIDLDLEELPRLKRSRQAALTSGVPSVTLYTPYQGQSSRQPQHVISVLGNPSLGSIRSVLIGVRNRSGRVHNAEVWVNELRVGAPKRAGGWAAQAQLDLELSDIAQLQLRGRHSTSGFGLVEQSRQERQKGEQKLMTFSAGGDLGRFLDAKGRVSIPISYSYSQEHYKPEYSPLDEDVYLKDALRDAHTLQSAQAHAHLTNLSLGGRSTQALTLTNVGVDLKSKYAMPYDPANIKLSYSYSHSQSYSPSHTYQRQLDWQLGAQYDYSPPIPPWRPLRRMDGSGSFTRYLRELGLQLWPSRLTLQTSLRRSYTEEQLRNQLDSEPTAALPATFSGLFIWYRKMHITWRPLPDFSLSLTTGTDARIEAPHVQVNRRLNPDDYALWRDAVDESLRHLGHPERYQQQATASYVLPLTHWRPTSWISGTLAYSSSYQWYRGAEETASQRQMPNTLVSSMSLDYTLQLSLAKLYALVPRLSRLEKRRSPWLALRELQLAYKQSRSTFLPGYTEDVGDAFGQSSEGGVLRPGIAFALGLSGADYMERAFERGWLTQDPRLALSGSYTSSRILDFKATLRPLEGLSIVLLGNHTETRRTNYQFPAPASLYSYGGDMQMTTIGFRGFFSRLSAHDGYRSTAFDRFLAARAEVAQMLAGQLRDAHYPSQGFLDGTAWAGAPLGTVATPGLNHPAVLIPAFRQSYILNAGGLEPIQRALTSLLPNWTITYNLGRSLSSLRGIVQNLSFRHAYRGIYQVHSYTSVGDWLPLEGTALGVTPSLNGSSAPRLSLLEDIASVSLSETFFPLLGLELSLRSGIGLSGQWRKSRALTLSLSASRLIETVSDEWAIGLSYRIGRLSDLWKPRPSGGVPSASSTTMGRGLTAKVDYSWGKNLSLVRQLTSGMSQTTLGSKTWRVSFSLDYELSRLLTLRGYYELSNNTPLVSTNNWGVRSRSYGLSLRLSLAP